MLHPSVTDKDTLHAGGGELRQRMDLSLHPSFDLRFTRDPFDALIVASARDLSLPLITRDASIREAGAVKTIW